jgi:hypothetical protein
MEPRLKLHLEKLVKKIHRRHRSKSHSHGFATIPPLHRNLQTLSFRYSSRTLRFFEKKKNPQTKN